MLLMGLGNSCNQPLLAKRPSNKCASGRKTISYSPLACALCGDNCAAFFAVSLYLLRNSNESFDTGDYQLVLSGGQLFIWHGDDPNPRKPDKPDLILLACVTSISFLAWLGL